MTIHTVPGYHSPTLAIKPPTTDASNAAARTSTKTTNLGAILMQSVFWTTVAMLLGVGLPMWWFTGQIWDGIGLGAFCALWGGPGFGTMIAGSIWTARNESH